HAGARFCEMREGAECGRAGEALPANKPLRYRRVSDGIGAAIAKRTAVLGEYPPQCAEFEREGG
ncbi:hypothetical protein, partial [Neisseria gonorrhoeae]|uniref:hypothetical protein n=4 Tax=Neisseria gonorrhoeae TaxID=485 RepID=UPI001F4EA6A5